jgi:hypothetical protein
MIDCKGDLGLTLSYQKFTNDIAVVNRFYFITANRAAVGNMSVLRLASGILLR